LAVFVKTCQTLQPAAGSNFFVLDIVVQLIEIPSPALYVVPAEEIIFQFIVIFVQATNLSCLLFQVLFSELVVNK
jgi:hypothetical protein